MAIFGWTYFQFGSRYVYDETWALHRLMQSVYQSWERGNYYSIDNELWKEKYHDGKGLCFGESEWCNYFVFLHDWLGYIFGLWSRLGEIGVRTTFIALTSTTALLFQELDDRIEKIAKKSENVLEDDCANLSTELDEWRSHYDLLCKLVKLMNRCFGFSLLLITGHDFATSIFEFNNILDHVGVSKGLHTDFENLNNYYQRYSSIDYVLNGNILFFFKSDPIKTLQFVHPLLRFLAILITSHNVNSKVSEIL